MTNKHQATSYYMKEQSQNYNKKSIFCFSLGLILLILGLLLLLTYSYIFEYFITQGSIFLPGKYAFEMWKKPDTLVYFDYYFFNWTNPEDINNPDIKPKFEEVGPYRYRLYIDRANLTYNYENSTITYQNQRTFYYDKNSPKNHSDVINSINVVALSAAYYGKDSFLIRPFVGTALIGSSIYVKKTVRELLFDGYTDSILSMSKFISVSTPFGVPDKFGWFYIVNGTAGIDGTFNMDVSEENFGKLRYLNYENKSTYFEDACSEIQGPIGELYPRNLKPTILSSYHSEMCRPMKLHFDKKVDVNGILGYKFVTFPDIFDNGTQVKENKCYCKGDCLPFGVAPTCTLDYPLYYSLPHFYNADPSYLEALEGLKPNKDLHDYTVTMEPITGATVESSAKLQFNLLLEPMPFSLFEDIPKKILFPILWFKQSMVLPDDVRENLSLLGKMPNIVQILAICLIIIGTICVVATILYVIYSKNKISQKKEIPFKEEVPLQRKC